MLDRYISLMNLAVNRGKGEPEQMAIKRTCHACWDIIGDGESAERANERSDVVTVGYGHVRTHTPVSVAVVPTYPAGFPWNNNANALNGRTRECTVFGYSSGAAYTSNQSFKSAFNTDRSISSHISQATQHSYNRDVLDSIISEVFWFHRISLQKHVVEFSPL